MSPAQLHLELEMAELRKQQYLKQVGLDTETQGQEYRAATGHHLEDFGNSLGGPQAITYAQRPPQPPANADKVYLTDIQDDWSDEMSNDFNRQARPNVQVKMHEIELPKYNEKIKMLE